MTPDEYQEIVESAYCKKALSIEAFDADSEFDLSSLLQSGGTWSSDGVIAVGTEGETRQSKEKEVKAKYEQLVLEYRPLVQDALMQAVKNNYYQNVLKTWREVESHACVLPCCVHAETQQRVYVRYHPTDYSNHELQFKKLNELIGRISKYHGIERSKLLATFNKYTPTPDVTSGEIDPEEKLRKFVVDWKVTRQLIREKNSNIALGSSALTPDELNRLSLKHPLMAELVMRLKIIQKKVLHCGHCYKEYWFADEWEVPADPDDMDAKKEFFWVAVADKITRSILETCVENAAIRPPKSVAFLDGAGVQYQVEIGGKNSGEYEKSILREAILSGYAFGNEISVRADRKGGEETWVAPHPLQSDYNVNIALAPSVIQRLGGELKSFYSELAAHLNNISRDDWCNSRAGQMLYAVQQAGFMFTVEQAHKATLNFDDGTSPKHHTNLIRLTEEVDEKIRALFVDENEVNWLRELFGRERLPPMVCPPLERPLERPDEGGYLTERMHSQKPLISDLDGRQHLQRARFSPSDEAIQTINALQKTSWKVDKYDTSGNEPPCTYDVVRQILEHEIKSNVLAKLVIQKEGKKYVLVFEDFKEGVRKIRNGQVREWMDTFQFIERLHDEFPGDPTFWHAWQFDWRGRMNPTTPMLSPQNDDVCRGLLRFSAPVRLDSVGVKWLGRFTASLFRNRDKTVLKLSNGPAYTKLLQQLQDRTWSSFDNVAEDPLFLEMISEILSLEVIEGYKIWGEGDVFRKKAEGFQRYAAMKEFYRVMKEGPENVNSSLPVHLDASSSIYQHASALLRDFEMGQKVNVVPREDGMPADVYEHVATALRGIWKEKGFLVDEAFDELSSQTKETIMANVLQRSVAKGPVMTKGYGTGHDSMKKSLMTHNGDPDGKMGGETDVIKNIGEETVQDKAWYAHEESTLGFLHDLGEVQLYHHDIIASTVVSGYTEAIKKVLPSFGHVLDILKQLVELNYIEPRIDAHLEQDALTDIISNHVAVEAKKELNWPAWTIKGVRFKQKDDPTLKAINESLKTQGWVVKLENATKKEQSLGLRPHSVRYNAVTKPLFWNLPDGKASMSKGQSNPAMAALLEREAEGGSKPNLDVGFDGSSRIENWKWFDNNRRKVEPWSGARSHRKLTGNLLQKHKQHHTLDLNKAVPNSFTLPVDVDGLKKAYPKGEAHASVVELENIETDRLNNLRTKLASPAILNCVPEEYGGFDWKKLRSSLSLPETDDVVTYEELRDVLKDENDARALVDYFYPFDRRLTYQVIGQNRAVSKEKTAVAPNFIHSLDALHMRRFVRDMHRANHQDLWAVHDSFGCHANHVEAMRTILRTQFSAIHNLATEEPNVLMKVVDRVLRGLPMQKLTRLSAYWSVELKNSKSWKKMEKEGLKPLEITKKKLGVALVESAHSLLGDMTYEDTNSEYFVN